MFTFRAMNTDVSVRCEDEHEARLVAEHFAQVERRFSRFLADSELSKLNRATGWFEASPELFDALLRAREHSVRTGGLFDPAVGAALVALGYDRSFAPGALDRASIALHDAQRARFDDVQLDPVARAVLRPRHVQLDLGGMLKGATVDRVIATFEGVSMVDAGGDAFMRGDGPERDGWLVDVEDPQDATRTVATVRVRDRAVATTAANRRQWRVGRASAHHVIDPRTGRPAQSDLAQVTVFAPRTELADVLAKSAFILGSLGARALIEADPSLGAVLVSTRGERSVLGAVALEEAR
jgi:thiamine biosynthesis lipoprotein